MTLKQMRIAAGYSQAELALLGGVNLRSLQDYEQGHKSIANAKVETVYRLSLALGCSVDEICAQYCPSIDIETNKSDRMSSRLNAYQNALNRRASQKVHFPVIVEDDSIDMSQIYPTKQLEIKHILEALRNNKLVKHLYLFGSSTNMCCNKDSDIDLAVELFAPSVSCKNEVSEQIQIACNWDADIIWIDRISKDERIYDNIMKGVVLI